MKQKNKQSQADDMAMVTAERDKLVKICGWVIGAIVVAAAVIATLTLTGVL